MGKAKNGMIRFRVYFHDYHRLKNSQLSKGQGRCWLLLRPSIATFDDLASHLRKKFALHDHLVFSIGNFVLPPFESTRIIKDMDIIRVKQKNFRLKDACKPCDSQNVDQDSQMASVHSLSFSNHNADETMHGNTPANVSNENAAHDRSSALGILGTKQKREDVLKLCNFIGTEKQDTSGGSNFEVHADDNTYDVGLVVPEPETDVYLGKHLPSLHLPCKERQQMEGIVDGLESELHTQFVSKVTKRPFKEDYGKRKSNGLCDGSVQCFDRKLEGDPLDKKIKMDVCRTDFFSLFPLIRSPQKGDILAYRYVEPSSTVYPELSSPQVGRVLSYDNHTSIIILVPALEFEVFSAEIPRTPMALPRLSPYKEDGSLEIKLSALIDVRMLKAHDFGKDNGAKYCTNRRDTLSPAEAFFWEFALSKGAFGKGGKYSVSGKC